MSARAVVVAHRAAMVAEGIAAALGRYSEIVPIAVATNARDGEAHGRRAHAVALDNEMPGAEQAAASLRRHGVRVVLLDDEADPEADDTRVSTHAPVSVLASALVPETGVARRGARGMTARERDVLALVARGLAGKQVARILGISPKTVEHYKARIYAKLGVRSQAAAVRLVMAEGIDERPALAVVGAGGSRGPVRA